MNENDPIEIFAGNMVEAGMVKSLLENAEIHAFLKDELMGTLNPWYVSAGGVGSVKIVVSYRDYPRAKLIVDEYDHNIKR